jgi:hypothetical protein
MRQDAGSWKGPWGRELFPEHVGRGGGRILDRGQGTDNVVVHGRRCSGCRIVTAGRKLLELQ